MRQLAAIRALRWNYRWAGVRVWLKARHRYRWDGRYACWTYASPALATWTPFGWWMVLRHPSLVIAQQTALAEGVTS